MCNAVIVSEKCKIKFMKVTNTKVAMINKIYEWTRTQTRKIFKQLEQ